MLTDNVKDENFLCSCPCGQNNEKIGFKEPVFEPDKWNTISKHILCKKVRTLAKLERKVNLRLKELIDLRFHNETLDIFITIYNGDYLEHISDEEKRDEVLGLYSDLIECDRKLLDLDPLDYSTKLEETAYILELLVESRAIRGRDHRKESKFPWSKSLSDFLSSEEMSEQFEEPSASTIVNVQQQKADVVTAVASAVMDHDEDEHAEVNENIDDIDDNYDAHSFVSTSPTKKIQKVVQVFSATSFIRSKPAKQQTSLTTMKSMNSRSVMTLTLKLLDQQKSISASLLSDSSSTYSAERSQLSFYGQKVAADNQPASNRLSGTSDVEETSSQGDQVEIKEPMKNAEYNELYKLIIQLARDFNMPCKLLINCVNKISYKNNIKLATISQQKEIINRSTEIIREYIVPIVGVDGVSGYDPWKFYRGLKKVKMYLLRKDGQCIHDKSKLKPSYRECKEELVRLDAVCFELNASKQNELEFLFKLAKEKAEFSRKVNEQYNKMACETTDIRMFRYDRMLKEDCMQGAQRKRIRDIKHQAYKSAACAIHDMIIMHSILKQLQADQKIQDSPEISKMPKNFEEKFYDVVKKDNRLSEEISRLSRSQAKSIFLQTSLINMAKFRNFARMGNEDGPLTESVLVFISCGEKPKVVEKEGKVTKGMVRGLSLRRQRTNKICSEKPGPPCVKAREWLEKAVKYHKHPVKETNTDKKRIRYPETFIVNKNCE